MKDEILFEHRDRLTFLHHTKTVDPDTDRFAFRSHSHNMVELYYFIGGQARFAVEGNIYELSPGTVLLMACGQTHHLLIEGNAAYERIALLIDAAALPPQYEKWKDRLFSGQHAFLLDEGKRSWWEQSVGILQKTEEKYRQKMLIELFDMMLSLLFGQAENMELPERQDKTVQQTVRFVNEHLAEPFSLDDIAGALYVNKATLSRKFRAVMGCSIWEFVLRKRVFAARGRLPFADSVKEVYEASGFGEYSSFYRAYKKYIGASPTDDFKTIKKNL